MKTKLILLSLILIILSGCRSESTVLDAVGIQKRVHRPGWHWQGRVKAGDCASLSVTAPPTIRAERPLVLNGAESHLESSKGEIAQPSTVAVETGSAVSLKPVRSSEAIAPIGIISADKFQTSVNAANMGSLRDSSGTEDPKEKKKTRTVALSAISVLALVLAVLLFLGGLMYFPFVGIVAAAFTAVLSIKAIRYGQKSEDYQKSGVAWAAFAMSIISLLGALFMTFFISLFLVAEL